MQVWLDYHLQKRRFVSIFFVPHSRPKFRMLPVWQSHLCLHQWNTDGELSRILCIQSTLKETCQQNFSVIYCVHARGNRNVKSPVFVQSRTLHVLTYVLTKDENHVKTSIHIPLQKSLMCYQHNHVHFFDELFHFSAKILFGLSLV